MTDQQKAIIKLMFIIAALSLANMLIPLFGTYLSNDEQTFLILAIILAGGAVYAFNARAQLNVFIKNWPTSLIYSAFILYACKILAEKVINGRTGIEVENIRYASTIGGAIYSVPVSMILISMFLYAKMMLRAFLPVASTGDKEKSTISSFYKVCFIGSVLWLGMSIFPQADAVIPYTVLVDSSKITTCGPVENDVVYVRKNSETCKRIHVNPFEGIYESTEVQSKSG